MINTETIQPPQVGGSELNVQLCDDGCEMRVELGRGVNPTPSCRGNGHYQCADCALLDKRQYDARGPVFNYIAGRQWLLHNAMFRRPPEERLEQQNEL